MSVLKAMRTVAQIAGYFVFLFGIAGAFVVVLVAFFHLFIFFKCISFKEHLPFEPYGQ